MALDYDNHTTDTDEFSHDSLMGLQELDSHLSLFDSTSQIGKTSSATSLVSTGDRLTPLIDGDDHTAAHDKNMTTFEYAGTPLLDLINPVSDVKADNAVSSKGSVATSTPLGTYTSIKVEPTNGSVTPMASDPSEASSVLTSISSSSKGASPADGEPYLGEPIDSSLTNNSGTKPRPRHTVKAKISIPVDLAPEEYANQCIAAAEASRLNPYALHTEEHELLRAHLSHSQVTTYLNIRNSILRLWIRNPTISVLRDEAKGCCKDVRWFDVASLSYDWLVRSGHINYGCAEYVESQYPPRKRGRGRRRRKMVAVIGAGMAGLACARQLEGLLVQYEDKFKENDEDIPEVVLVEGRDRIGGRVYSKGFRSTGLQTRLPNGDRATAEMGGMIITGFDRGNPLNILVRAQLALPYHSLKPTTTLYDSNGQPVDQTRDNRAENLYNDILERVSEYKFKSTPRTLVEGERDLINTGKDAHSDHNKTIMEIEDGGLPIPSTRAIPSAKNTPTRGTTAERSTLPLIPTGSDRLTGQAHVAPGVPAVHTVAVRANQMGWNLHDGVTADKDLDLLAAAQVPGSTLGSVMDEAFLQFRNIAHMLPLDLRLVNWHIANLEYSNAIGYTELSLGGWDVDAGNEWEGKHTMVIGGYQKVARGLLQCPRTLKLRKKAPVKRIEYDPNGERSANITCMDGSTIKADWIVSTIPLGALKSNDVHFEPSLPDWKCGAIERIGFGILNKIVLVYKEAFWDTTRDIFGLLREASVRASSDQRDYATNRGRFFQWFNVTKTSGVPTLLVLMAGEAAFYVERTPDTQLVQDATLALREIFGAQVPTPVEHIVTRWGKDKFTHGSYSYTGPDFHVDDYHTMAKPIGNLFFAGEHTSGTHPATVHGAYLSGIRAASEVLTSIIGPIEHPTPLLPSRDTPASLKRKVPQWAEPPTDPKGARLWHYENEVWTAIYAKFGERPIRPAKVSANPYILYGKQNFEVARQRCEELKKSNKGGRPVANEVRVMLAKMWKNASEEEKRPFNEEAEDKKREYASKLQLYTEASGKWDRETLEWRGVYEREHPSVPGKDEPIDDEWTRGRKAKRAALYREVSASEGEK